MRWRFFLLGMGLGLSSSPILAGEMVSFKIPAKPRLINPLIYGFGSYLHEDRAKEGIWELRPGIYRWGGNTSSRFNYKIDAWNAGADWYFHNFKASQPGMIDRFMSDNLRQGIGSMITLPMLGWVAKDGESYSFPKSRFPDQERFEGDAGNGVTSKGKRLISDPKLSSIAIDPDFVAGWVKKLKSQFGKHPHYYIMDNEPMLWNSTHRDVQSEPMRYDTYFNRYVAYAQAVRSADPEAHIIGPAAWGWMEMQYSAWDIEGPHSQGKRQTDRKAHGDRPFLEWFLDQLKKKEKELKISLLDSLDVHYYPEMDRWPAGEDSSPGRRKALLQSTRSLWDPDYKDKSWINEKIHFIPRLQQMAEKFKSGMGVSIGEYNFRSEFDVSGAIAQAEILGIFAKTGLQAAQYWDYPKTDGTHRYAFLLFRNYDGKGHGFGNEWIDNSFDIKDEAAVFAARQGADRRITLILLNKSVDRSQDLQLDLKGLPPSKSLKLFSYHAPGSDGKIKSSSRQLKAGKTPTVSMPLLSMHLLELNY